MDVVSRMKWTEYSKAKDEMFSYTDTKQSPWYVVDSDDKKRAQLNFISHLLTVIPYDDIVPEKIELEPRPAATGYVRPPMNEQTIIPNLYQ